MVSDSIDLRQKILSAWQNKEGTQRDLAKRFKVSLSFIRDFLRPLRFVPHIVRRTFIQNWYKFRNSPAAVVLKNDTSDRL
ncbi:hypothetical protein [Nostoc sp.]|uniref:hypothetical protein n=1 Tax=Nostoc sp. TaxID=1180 RepID=UPI002FF44FEE